MVIKDEEMDMEFAKKLEAELKDNFSKCFQCGTCTASCPVGEVTQYRVRKLMRMAQLGLKERILNMDDLWDCTTCAICKARCPWDVDPLSTILKLRRESIKDGHEQEKHKKFSDAIKATGNAFGEKEPMPSVSNPKAKYVYFPGCVASYRQKDVFDATIKILDMIGVDYEIPEGLACCGSVLMRTGHEEEFEAIKEKNLKLLKGKNIITSCAGCYATLKADYGLDVNHITDIIKENIDKLPLKEIKKKVMYHDPCHLGRKFDYYDIPREIIEAIPGVELIPFDEEKENSQCCGAGGGVKSARPEIANDLAQKRMDEAKEKNADVVLSSCPFCELNLADNNNDIPVMDILNLLMEAMEVKA